MRRPAQRLQDGDEVAMIPPVSAAGATRPTMHAGSTTRIAADPRAEPFGTEILADLTDRLATPEDGAAVGFLGRTRVSPGTPAPGQEVEAARHAGRRGRVAGLRGPRDDGASASSIEIADEIVARFGVDRLAIVHRIGEVPSARRASPSWPSLAASRMPPSVPPATRSTRPRRGPRSGRPSSSPTGTSGSASRPGHRPADGSMTPDAARSDSSIGCSTRRDRLAGAWGARARPATTAGPGARAPPPVRGQRPGSDGSATGRRRGRSVARRGSHEGLGAGIALPFAMALLEYDLEPQQLALDVASGSVDLALEAELLRESDRRARSPAPRRRAWSPPPCADRRRADGAPRARGPARRGRAPVAGHDPGGAGAGRRTRRDRGPGHGADSTS